MYVALARKIKAPRVDFRESLRSETALNGRMSRPEIVMSLILFSVVALWITASHRFGLGGPAIFGVVLMLIFRIIRWRHIQNKVRFDVVGLYAAACAMGVGLKVTGASLWLARTIVHALPESMQYGEALLWLWAIWGYWRWISWSTP